LFFSIILLNTGLFTSHLFGTKICFIELFLDTRLDNSSSVLATLIVPNDCEYLLCSIEKLSRSSSVSALAIVLGSKNTTSSKLLIPTIPSIMLFARPILVVQSFLVLCA